LATLYADREIGAREWVHARKAIEDRRDANARKLSRATNTGRIRAIVGQGDALSAQWASLNLGRKRAIIETIFDHAVIGPGSPRATAVDPERVRPVWRL
jgi:hypothetical protein